MTTAGRKIVRDFWQERTRTVFVVLAIALGIAGFAAVLSSYAILTRELDRGYLATNPASATLRTSAVTDDLLAAVAAHPGVGDVEARRSLNGRVKVGPVEWRNLVLFVVKDFAAVRISALRPQQGAWPPAAGEILIERDALQVARVKVGDTLTLRTSRGEEQSLRVSGTVQDVGQAQARMENIVYGYIALETLALLGEEPFLDQLKLLVAEDRFDEAHIRGVAEEVRRLVEGRGHTVRSVDVPRPGKHPHTEIMGLLLLSMASFGLFVLLLSSILVVNLLTALMASQKRQIGMMKAVGGRRWQIARIYLGQALLLGLLAIAVALPAGIIGGRILCRYMAVFLNFDITSFAVPVWVYLLIVAVGLVVPLLAAAYPVWKGSKVSVREALSDFGVSRNHFGTGAFDRALAGMGGMTRPLLLAIRNSFRRRVRLALTLITLAAGGLFFLSALNVRASLIYSLDRLFATKKFDLTVHLNRMYPVEAVERAVRRTPGVRQAEGWIATQGSVVGAAEAPDGDGHAGAAGGTDRFNIQALPPGTELQRFDIIEGRGLLPEELDAIVVNAALAAREPRLRTGNTVTLQIEQEQKSWRVVGVAREFFSPAMAYIPIRYLEQNSGRAGMTNNVRLTLEKTDPASLNELKASLDQNLEGEGVRAQSSSSKADSRFGFDQHMVMIYVFLIVVSGIVGGVGGLGLMTTMSLNVLERRREMGVLRAMGATPLVLWLIVIAEGAVIGVLSWFVAALAAWPVSKAIGSLLVRLMFRSDLNFYFEPAGLLIWLAVSVLLSAVASFLPAYHASRCSVREAVGYE